MFIRAPRHGRRCDWRRASVVRGAIRCMPRWLAAGSLIALVACDSLSSMTGGKPVTDLADPGPIAFNTEAVPFVPPERGRTVASVPVGRRLDDPGPEIIVRGRESEAPQIAVRGPGGNTATGRSG